MVKIGITKFFSNGKSWDVRTIRINEERNEIVYDSVLIHSIPTKRLAENIARAFERHSFTDFGNYDPNIKKHY